MAGSGPLLRAERTTSPMRGHDRALRIHSDPRNGRQERVGVVGSGTLMDHCGLAMLHDMAMADRVGIKG